jgi:hypothetical protein
MTYVTQSIIGNFQSLLMISELYMSMNHSMTTTYFNETLVTSLLMILELFMSMNHSMTTTYYSETLIL